MRSSLFFAGLVGLVGPTANPATSARFEHTLTRAQNPNQITIYHEPAEAVWDPATGQLADHAIAILQDRWRSVSASEQTRSSLLGDVVSAPSNLLLHRDESWGITVVRTENEGNK